MDLHITLRLYPRRSTHFVRTARKIGGLMLQYRNTYNNHKPYICVSNYPIIKLPVYVTFIFFKIGCTMIL